jgi:N6-L-threonylcarbamoyladenine synthase
MAAEERTVITLGIETSCDETAAALVEDGKVLSSEVSSSVHLHSCYGGVVPEIASRYHTEYIYSVVEKALADAGKKMADVDLVAVTYGPGLPGSLLVGLAFAKAVSLAEDIPVIGVNHLTAHLMSCFLAAEGSESRDDRYPFTGMVISGGHTSIYEVKSAADISIMGRTRDDAVGEAFDKVAKMLGLGYPGGPVVERMAARFSGREPIPFTRALLKDKNDLDLSFSGVKTAVMYYWRGCEKTDEEIERICYSFQECVVDVITEKFFRAARIAESKKLAAGGGVVNNSCLRERLLDLAGKEGVELCLPPLEYCSDNAAMIAALGEELYLSGERSDTFINARPGAC